MRCASPLAPPQTEAVSTLPPSSSSILADQLQDAAAAGHAWSAKPAINTGRNLVRKSRMDDPPQQAGHPMRIALEGKPQRLCGVTSPRPRDETGVSSGVSL